MNRLTIAILWLIILVGLMSHTLMHLVPAFYDINIVKPNANGEMPWHMTLILGFSFLIPVASATIILCLQNNVGKIINFIFAALNLLVATGHLSEPFTARRFDAVQLFIIVPLFFVSLILTYHSWNLLFKKSKTSC